MARLKDRSGISVPLCAFGTGVAILTPRFRALPVPAGDTTIPRARRSPLRDGHCTAIAALPGNEAAA